MMQIAGLLSRKKAGYGLKECDGAKEVEKAQVPILFIHGDKDNFVPVEMCEKLYQNCRSPKQKLIVAGASHAESYYKDTQSYQDSWDRISLCSSNHPEIHYIAQTNRQSSCLILLHAGITSMGHHACL